MLPHTIKFFMKIIFPFRKKRKVVEEKLSLQPPEIFKIILSYLDLKDIFALAGTSKKFHLLIERYFSEYVLYHDAKVEIGDGYSIITSGNESVKRGTYDKVNQILKEQFNLNNKINKMNMSFTQKFLTYFNDIIKELTEDKEHGFISQIGLGAAVIAIDMFLMLGEKLELSNTAAIIIGAGAGYTFGDILQTHSCALFNLVMKKQNDELAKSKEQLSKLPKIIYDHNLLRVVPQ